jgi:prophage regulatory protein
MDQLLSISDVLATTSLSKTTVYVLMRAGRFPKTVQLSTNRVAWKASDVQAWIAQRTGAHAQ